MGTITGTRYKGGTYTLAQLSKASKDPEWTPDPKPTRKRSINARFDRLFARHRPFNAPTSTLTPAESSAAARLAAKRERANAARDKKLIETLGIDMKELERQDQEARDEEEGEGREGKVELAQIGRFGLAKKKIPTLPQELLNILYPPPKPDPAAPAPVYAPQPLALLHGPPPNTQPTQHAGPSAPVALGTPPPAPQWGFIYPAPPTAPNQDPTGYPYFQPYPPPTYPQAYPPPYPTPHTQPYPLHAAQPYPHAYPPPSQSYHGYPPHPPLPEPRSILRGSNIYTRQRYPPVHPYYYPPLTGHHPYSKPYVRFTSPTLYSPTSPRPRIKTFKHEEPARVLTPEEVKKMSFQERLRYEAQRDEEHAEMEDVDEMEEEDTEVDEESDGTYQYTEEEADSLEYADTDTEEEHENGSRVSADRYSIEDAGRRTPTPSESDDELRLGSSPFVPSDTRVDSRKTATGSTPLQRTESFYQSFDTDSPQSRAYGSDNTSGPRLHRVTEWATAPVKGLKPAEPRPRMPSMYPVPSTDQDVGRTQSMIVTDETIETFSDETVVEEVEEEGPDGMGEEVNEVESSPPQPAEEEVPFWGDGGKVDFVIWRDGY